MTSSNEKTIVSSEEYVRLLAEAVKDSTVYKLKPMKELMPNAKARVAASYEMQAEGDVFAQVEKVYRLMCQAGLSI